MTGSDDIMTPQFLGITLNRIRARDSQGRLELLKAAGISTTQSITTDLSSSSFILELHLPVTPDLVIRKVKASFVFYCFWFGSLFIARHDVRSVIPRGFLAQALD